MNTKDFYYDLPEDLIAQTPVEPRDSSRLMVVDRKTGKIEHKIFHDIADMLTPNDVLVINETKVMPARLFCNKKGFTGKIEILLLKRLENLKFEALARPLRRIHIGETLEFSPNLTAVVENKVDGNAIIRFSLEKGTLEEELDRIGEMPLPPYIHEKLKRKDRYQTVYARVEGSAAAPTAGLHFTPELLEKIKQKGIQIVKVVLDVGLGTFRPVQTQNIEDHHMHTEHCVVSAQSADALNKAKAEGKRIIAVGTTSVRTLETACQNGKLVAGDYNTSIFIYPGKQFGFVDSIITNFHLPESTLIMLISAFMGTEQTLNCYKVAVQQKYRFFSFGDAMWIK